MFLSCTTLYKCFIHIITGFFMQIFVQKIIHIVIGFCHAHLCTNDYLIINLFLMNFFKTGIFSYLLAFRSDNQIRHSTMVPLFSMVIYYASLALFFRFHHLHDALQRMNSVVRLTHYNFYSNV